ncbi:AAA family ATPase, partial [Streptomyces toxytricini]
MTTTATQEPPAPARQMLPAEERHADELAFLAAQDTGPRPPGWALTPRAV